MILLLDAALLGGITKEAQLEVIDIIEIPTDSYDKNLENSKNVRSLHLRDVEGNCYSLNANNRRSLEKSVFIGTEAVVGLDKKTKDVLQIWLAARYFRHSFPDALDREVAGVIKTLAKNIKDKEDAIIGIFVRYEEINCTPNAEVYEFWVKIVYDPEKSDAETMAYELLRGMESKLGKSTKLLLSECSVVADSEFTLKDVSQYNRFWLDYLCV